MIAQCHELSHLRLMAKHYSRCSVFDPAEHLGMIDESLAWHVLLVVEKVEMRALAYDCEMNARHQIREEAKCV